MGGAAVVGSMSISGCSSEDAGGGTSTATSTVALPDAEPIAPLAVPETWDDEADVVVVGMGGGGLAASTYLTQQGLTVIALEKSDRVGGATRHATNIVNAFGGSTPQNELSYGWPTFPLDINAFLRRYSEQHQYSVNENLVKKLVLTAGEAIDWLVAQSGVDLVCRGLDFSPREVQEGRQNHVMGMNSTVNAVEACALAAGVDLRCLTECKALVSDNGSVAGIMASDASGDETYIKAGRGVIFCAGGIGMNKDLIKAYLPSAFAGTVTGGPMPSHTGDAFRMGLGMGADYAGFDSWCCWESAIDETIAGGDGQFFHYFWHGERQLFHNPWLIIDMLGNRVPYYSNGVSEGFKPDPGITLGDLMNCSAQMSRIGGHVYSICDSNFPETIYEQKPSIVQEVGGDTCRVPVSDPDKLIDTGGLVTADWLGEVDDAVARGAVKKADSIEELADMLLLDRAIVVNAVKNWNKMCERGVDDELATPYDPTWLIPVQDPPYYAAIIGGQMGKTMCGLRVDENLQVMKADGTLIPGLYANFTTAGGLTGECDYGGFWNSSPFAGNAMSWVSGYAAAKTILANR